MRILTKISLTVLGCLAVTNPSLGQFTNAYPPAPATKLEAFETNIAVVILRAGSQIGALSANGGTVVVKCRQITETSTGHNEEGIAVEFTQRGQVKDTVLIDYDEMASLQNALDYLGKLDLSVTPLTGFDATYTTKGGFRIAALGTRRSGVIQFAVRDARNGLSPIILTRQEMLQLSTLISQAKTTLDALRRR